MNCKFVVLVACGLSLLGGGVARSAEKDDPVPLRNWVVPFEAPSQIAASLAVEGAVTANALPSVPSNFKAVTPCRVVDTRNAAGPYGGPVMLAGQTREFDIDGGGCSIPANAVAYSLNFTVVSPSSSGWIQVGPGGSAVPFVSTLNFAAGQTIANAAIVPAGTGGSIAVLAAVANLHLIIDINGYFPGATTLASGETLVGVFAAVFVAGAVGEGAVVPFTFSPKLASTPTALNSNVIPSGGSPTANCPGSASNPSAAPGHVCIYESLSTNATSRCITRTNVGWTCGAASPFGAAYYFESAAAGRAYSVGTWAVTAP